MYSSPALVIKLKKIKKKVVRPRVLISDCTLQVKKNPSGHNNWLWTQPAARSCYNRLIARLYKVIYHIYSSLTLSMVVLALLLLLNVLFEVVFNGQLIFCMCLQQFCLRLPLPPAMFICTVPTVFFK